MQEVKINLRALLTFCLVVSTAIVISPNNALAGYRRCQGYPDNTLACITETGFRFDCRSYEGGGRTICTGKNNYRKECFTGDETGVCNDSNGIKTTCRFSPSSNTVCENNKGYRSVCRRYDGNISICTDVSRWGKPIKE
jgi:hypothetical protein